MEGKNVGSVEVFSDLPFRLILDILEFVELVLLKRRNYELIDFYGYFRKDFKRKIFLFFSSLSIGYSSQLMEDIPFGQVRNLRCHYLSIPEQFLEKCMKLEGLLSCKIEPNNLACLRRKKILRRMDICLVSNNLTNEFFERINEFYNLTRLKLVSWKDSEQNNPLGLITNEISLQQLERLDIVDFPPFLNPRQSNFMIKLLRGNNHQKLKVLTFTSCDISNEILISLQGNEHINELKLNNCIIRDAIIQFLAHPPKNLRILSLSKSRLELTDTNDWEKFDIPSEREDYSPSNIEVLELSRIVGLPNHFFSEIRKYENVKILKFENCNLIDENIECLIRRFDQEEEEEEEEEEGEGEEEKKKRKRRRVYDHIHLWKKNGLVIVVKGNKELSSGVVESLENNFKILK